MKELYEDLHRGCEIASREYGDLLDKIEQNGKMSGADLEALDRLTHTIKSNKTTMAMMDAEGGSYDDGMDGRSYGDYHRSNRSYARRRDGMGRYARRAYDDGDMR